MGVILERVQFRVRGTLQLCAYMLLVMLVYFSSILDREPNELYLIFVLSQRVSQ